MEPEAPIVQKRKEESVFLSSFFADVFLMQFKHTTLASEMRIEHETGCICSKGDVIATAFAFKETTTAKECED
jgi:hypothetical protein